MKERIMWAVTAVLAIGIVAVLVMWHIDVKEKEVIDSSDEDFELPEMAASAMEEGYIVEDDSTDDSFSFEAGAAATEEDPVIEAEAEADSVDVPEDAVLVESSPSNLEDNPNELFRVSEEWASQHGGLYAKIGDGFYSLMNELPGDIIDKYNIGYSVGPEGRDITPDRVAVYLADYSNGLKSDIPSATRNAIVACGDFSPLQIHRNDPLVIFGDSIGETVCLEKVNFVGYTIPATENGQALNYYPVVNHLLPNNLLKDHIGVFNLDETPVEDVRNLEYGKEYLYECYLGTEYRGLNVVADSKCYVVKRDEELFTAEPTKFGYFVIDISSLEPGLYTYNYCVFEVVD